MPDKKRETFFVSAFFVLNFVFVSFCIFSERKDKENLWKTMLSKHNFERRLKPVGVLSLVLAEVLLKIKND